MRAAQSKRYKYHYETKGKPARKKDKIKNEMSTQSSERVACDGSCVYRLVLLFVKTEQIRATHQSPFLETKILPNEVRQATPNQNQFNQLAVVCVV